MKNNFSLNVGKNDTITNNYYSNSEIDTTEAYNRVSRDVTAKAVTTKRVGDMGVVTMYTSSEAADKLIEEGEKNRK